MLLSLRFLTRSTFHYKEAGKEEQITTQEKDLDLRVTGKEVLIYEKVVNGY
jgi:hypoxanthine-guanine phosphoribosyltransferase